MRGVDLVGVPAARVLAVLFQASRPRLSSIGLHLRVAPGRLACMSRCRPPKAAVPRHCRKVDLQPHELLTSVFIPFNAQYEYVKEFKQVGVALFLRVLRN